VFRYAQHCVNMTQARSLDALLSALKYTYSSLDIRALLLKKQSDIACSCVFLKIRFTKERPSDVKKSHVEATSRFQYSVVVPNSALEIKLLALGMPKAAHFLQNVKSGILKVDRSSNSIDSAVSQLSTAEATAGNGYLFDESYLLYEHLMIWSERNGFFTTFLKSQIGDTVNEVGIAGLLDLPSLQSVQSNTVMIFFPLYCRRLSLQVREKGLNFAKIDIHRSLISSCRVDIEKLTKPKSVITIPMAHYNFKGSGKMRLALVPLQKDVQVNDQFEVKVMHDPIGVVLRFRIYGEDILKAPYIPDPLIDAFRMFNAKINFYDYLTSKSSEPKRVASTSWLLSMLGLNLIPLGLLDREKDEKIISSRSQYACDILAFNGRTLFAIDCTDTAPKPNKVDKIKNTSDYLMRAAKVTEVVPVIICGEDCPTVRSNARINGVMVIELNQIVKCTNY
jgi:hypothetical protein